VRRSLRVALPAWIVARLVVGVALVADVALRSRTDLSGEPVGTRHHGGLLSWDASWYLRIAQHGYEPLPEEAVRFFPTLPLLVRGVGAVIGSDAVALLVITNVCALLFLAALHRLVAADLGDPALAERTVWLAALAPIAFVLVMGYTEAPAALAIVLAFGFARQRRWAPAAAAGLVAGSIRPMALLLAVPLLVEAARGARRAPWRERGLRVVAVASPVLGALPFVLWVQAQYGDWQLPYRVQTVEGLRGDTANPFRVVFDALRGLDGDDVILGTRGLWALALVALVAVSARRLPLAYTAFTAATIVVATSTEHIGSLERYGWAAFPVLIAAATCTARPQVDRAVLTVSGAAMATYALLAFADVYVP
jgi:hypothetical protein